MMLSFALAATFAARAQSPFTALHPEAAYPDPEPQVVHHPYSELIINAQQRLNGLGFDAGPPNGDFGAKTQAALAQFQLSRAIPASGQLDDRTLGELGLERPPTASAGASAEAAPGAQPE